MSKLLIAFDALFHKPRGGFIPLCGVVLFNTHNLYRFSQKAPASWNNQLNAGVNLTF